jgi:hypothetical protein
MRLLEGEGAGGIAGEGWRLERAPARVEPAQRAREGGLASAIFAALLVLGLVPLWIVPHLPTQDGGNHVESVMGLLRLPHSALLQHFYLPNYGPQPNWLTQILFAGLVQGVAPRVAEKLILSGYVILLPLAFRAALPRTARGRWASLAIFPFVASYPFHMGFWNFSYSLVLFFVAVGFWYRTRGRLSLGRGLAFTGITFALFVAHSVSTSAALAAVTAILAWRGGLGLAHAGANLRRRRIVLRGYLRRALTTYLYALPTIVLMGVFMVRQPKPLAYRPSLFDYVKHFVSLYALVSYSRWELVLTGAVALVVAAVVILELRARPRRLLRPADGWLAAAVLATGLYFAMPDAVADGAQINDRLALYPFFAALLWLGWLSGASSRLRAAGLALVVLFAAATGFRIVKYREIDGYLEEYASVARHVAPDSVLLPVTLSPFGPRAGHAFDGKKLLSYRVQPFTHAAGYIVAERDGIDLDNSQANTHHTPMRWKPELNPFTYLANRPFSLESEPPCVDLWVYPALGGRIDYVLLWGDAIAASQDACGMSLLRELNRDYERVYVSQPRGMAQLWRARQGT